MNSSEYQRKSSRTKLLEELDFNTDDHSSINRRRAGDSEDSQDDDYEEYTLKKENKRSERNPKEGPLRDLCVYVEVFNNNINISETTYSYLERLGAKIEKRLNKKCNLLIWKDGSLKTIEKAREYQIPIVNSLWLEDCIENCHCADFEKYATNIPQESELPFLTVQQSKKKRKILESKGSANFDADQTDENTNTPGLKRKKKTLDKSFSSESKIEINLGVQKKLSEIFEPKTEPKKLFTSSKTVPDIDSLFSRLEAREKQEKEKKRTISFGTDYYKEDSFKNTIYKYIFDSSNTSSSQNHGLSIEAILNKRKEEEESKEIRNMIMSYSRSNTISYFEGNKPQNESTQSRRRILRDEQSSEHSKDQNNSDDDDISESFYNRKNTDRNKKLERIDENPQEAMVDEKEEEETVDFSKLLSKYGKKDNNSKDEKIEVKEKSKSKRSTKNNQKEEQEPIEKRQYRTLNVTPFQEKQSKENDVVKKVSFSEKKETVKIQTDTFQSSKKLQTKELDSSASRSKIGNKDDDSPPVKDIISKYLSFSNSSSKENDASRSETKDKTKIETTSKLNEKKTGQNKLKDSILSSIFGDKDRSKTKSKEDIDSEEEISPSDVERKGKKVEPTKSSISRSSTLQRQTSQKINDEEEETSKSKANTSGQARSTSRRSFLTAQPIMITGFPKEGIDKVKQFCEKFTDYKYIPEEFRNISIMEIMVYYGPEIPKTYLIAGAISEGKKIVNCGWIYDSLKEGVLQDIENYLFKYSLSKVIDLFSGMRFNIDKDFESMPANSLGRDELKLLIQNTGGIVLDNLRACDFCIMRNTSKRKNTIPPHVKTITPQWLIDCIIEGKYLNTEHINYTIL